MRKIVCLILISLSLLSCGKNVPDTTKEEKNAKILPESEMQVIPLFGEASLREAEISGLAWYGDYLVLLPQYPYNYEHNGIGSVFILKKNEIEDYISGKSQNAITPEKIDFDAAGLEKFNVKGGGYESINFSGDTVYVTLESGATSTEAFIVRGMINPEKPAIKLDPKTLTKIKTPAGIPNLGDEAATVFRDTIYTFYEANGRNVNPHPAAYMFDKDLKFLGTKPFPSMEYRLTDATAADSSGKFCVINYFYPGDASDLDPAADSLVVKFGAGESQMNSPAVERLVEFQIKDDKIIKTETPPVQIKLAKNKDGRNWEGIVRFGERGFLLITDTFPQTIFAFVPMQEVGDNSAGVIK